MSAYKKTKTKTKIKEAHLWLCVYCNKRTKKLKIDHLIPKAKGGPDTIDNLVPACTECNTWKGSKNLLMFLAKRTENQKRMK